MRRRPTIGWMLGAMVAAMALGVGCRSDPPPPQQPPAAPETTGVSAFDEFRVEVRRDLDIVFDRVDEHTWLQPYELPDGSSVAIRRRKPAPPPPPREYHHPPRDMIVPTPGEFLAELGFEHLPEAIAVDDEGNVIIARRENVMLYPVDGLPRILVPGRATALQWGADGAELLVTGPGVKMLLAWPSEEILWQVDPQRTAGFVQLAPEGESLWLLRDRVSMDATEEVRVLWTVDVLARDGESSFTLSRGVPDVAAMGTLPLSGIAWAHERLPYQLSPNPAPLVRLDDMLAPATLLTETENSVDLNPTSDRHGRLMFIRAAREIDWGPGRALGPSARAWMTMIEDEEPWPNARPLTAEPTLAAALSPDGKHVALVLARNGVTILRTPFDDLWRRDLARSESATRRFQESMNAVLQDLRFRFALTTTGRSLEIGELGPVLTEPPSQGDIEVMGRALRESLHNRLVPRWTPTIANLGILDDLLTLSEGLWEEEPATVIALAAVYAEALQASGIDAAWLHEGATGFLSDFLQETSQPEPAANVFLHAPYYVARERLAGRLGLYDEAVGLLADARETPVRLVENFDSIMLQVHMATELERLGITLEDLTNPERVDQLIDEYAHDPLVSRILEGRALDLGLSPLAIRASVNAAMALPTSPSALLDCAGMVGALGLHEEAARLFRIVIEFVPDDMVTLLDVGESLVDIGAWEEARVCFERVRLLDTTGGFTSLVESNLEYIDGMTRDVGEDETPSPDGFGDRRDEG